MSATHQFNEGPGFFTLAPEQVLEKLGTGPEGLSDTEAQGRLESFGPNELAAAPKISPLLILLRQFGNILMVILIAATVISFALGERLDAYVIMAIVLACVVLGFVQEYRAEKATEALQKLSAPVATVIRDGEEYSIPSREVVPGDLLVLHTGDRVAADARLLEAVNLMADEAILTGESHPAHKKVDRVPDPHASLADQVCMVFGGTVITYGRGRAVVTATGMRSEFGRIARLLAEVKNDHTPLEKRMQTIGRVLAVICLVTASGASVLGVWRGHTWLEMLLWGISLAVAAVPESLPAVVTGALAIGTTRMARKNAIVKRLPAVETMGCITVICTDKTGTLTKNEMTVRRLFLDDQEIRVTGAGYEPEGEFDAVGRQILPHHHPVLHAAARIALLCNDASLRKHEGVWEVRGDPTEGALLVLGQKAGMDAGQLLATHPRVAEIPFTSERKRMATIHQGSEGFQMLLKGAPESLLPFCRKVLTIKGEKALSDQQRQRIRAEADHMAGEALRVLGLAYRHLSAIPDLTPEAEEDDLVWVGLVGMIDPPRPEAKDAVRRCRRAGIRPIMVTGDHPDTAAAIGRELGILPREKRHNPAVLTGQEVNAMDDARLSEAVKEVGVFARVSPSHKLRLVTLLKDQGEVVAMTGDGVNDAPALKRADIGVAMGVTGTEVTKETADMILADDNFATLVSAVEEGRAIFDNIKKYLVFLLSTNLAEILVLTGAFFLGMPMPLIALQILWINLITDGLPGLALGVDPKAPDIMSRPPRPPQEGVFSYSVNVLLGVISVYYTLLLIPLFAYYVYFNPAGHETQALVLMQAQTMVFLTLVLLELVAAFNCRSDYHSIFTVGIFPNRFLVIAVLISFVMMAAAIHWPPLAKLFHTVPLRPVDWLLATGLTLTLVPVVELAKWHIRRRSRWREL
ncbi:MAG: cation-translocating P-type ATPase [Deltaproteobacteria bacterium]|nr:cation-translocating P-type ATPase [Deltaproteobacteria bacterium]